MSSQEPAKAKGAPSSTQGSPPGYIIGLGLLSLLVLSAAIAVPNFFTFGRAPTCRNIPGDSTWPGPDDWAALNRSVDGGLIATIPVAAVCHTTLSGETNPLFDEEKCAALRDVWFYPETHMSSPTSPMAYPFTNNSCNPFSDFSAPCTADFLPPFTINATGVAHFQAAVRFAAQHNIRLVIRNTGHDYMGKSTGPHALALWTHHLKDLALVREYQGPGAYTGPAIKMGAGVEVIEAYKFAHAHGLMVVGGNIPSVGMTGGYTQGGGHGPLSSKFGLAADQVLEWEVVTASGELVTANADENPDLFWALRGGGAGTFGLVVSMTVKAFPDDFFSTASLALFDNGTNTDAIYSTLSIFLQNVPALVDAGVSISWLAGPFGLIALAVVPSLRPAELDTLIEPTSDEMNRLGLQYQYGSAEFPDFMSTYTSLGSSWNVSDYNLGGRLIPRSLVQDGEESTAALVGAIRQISSQTIVSGVCYNVSHAVSSPSEVAVNPYFRQTLFSLVAGLPINYTDWPRTVAAQNQITRELLPPLEKLTPGGAVYLNEGDFQDRDFKTTFYGAHYERLLRVKRKWDAEDIFYARTAVGSDRWEERPDGRLCRI